MLNLKADKSPAENFALTNRVTLHPTDHAQLGNAKHVVVRLPTGQQLVFTVEATGSNPAGSIGFNTPHRRWGAIEVTKSVSWKFHQISRFHKIRETEAKRTCLEQTLLEFLKNPGKRKDIT